MNLISVLKRKNNKNLFTTPSHNGRFCIFHKFYNWYKYDISEVDAYNPQEALKRAEENAAKIYGTMYTKFLTNGSTSGIIAAILASGAQNILIWDNAHICHKNGAELAGCKITEYSQQFNDELGVYLPVTSDKIEAIFKISKFDAIVITSPTYEGFAADIGGISALCKKYSVKLIVDEAHGALYPFSDKLPQSAVKLADYTVQSLHKTAGGINPTALLHSNDNNPEVALSKINTTSPSYPMLATIEANIRFLNSQKGRRFIERLVFDIESLKLPKYNDDITKIILKKENMSGYELSELLFDKYGIEDERTNDKSTMLLCGIGTDKRMLKRLQAALKGVF